MKEKKNFCPSGSERRTDYIRPRAVLTHDPMQLIYLNVPMSSQVTDFKSNPLIPSYKCLMSRHRVTPVSTPEIP